MAGFVSELPFGKQHEHVMWMFCRTNTPRIFGGGEADLPRRHPEASTKKVAEKKAPAPAPEPPAPVEEVDVDVIETWLQHVCHELLFVMTRKADATACFSTPAWSIKHVTVHVLRTPTSQTKIASSESAPGLQDFPGFHMTS